MSCSSFAPERTVALADLLSRRTGQWRGHRRGNPQGQLRATRAKSFAAKRVAYVLELAGSCMMIAVFLAMALFLSASACRTVAEPGRVHTHEAHAYGEADPRSPLLPRLPSRAGNRPDTRRGGAGARGQQDHGPRTPEAVDPQRGDL